MKNKKRLFLFAAYDARNGVDASLLHYVSALSKLGDVILFADNDMPLTELKKLRPFVLYANAEHHGEYDFGSYKRAYQYAKESCILTDYDFLYLVNDSVYGPLYDLSESLRILESMGYDAFGMVKNPHKEHPHIQSWFIGCNQSVFLAPFFDKFMNSVTQVSSKGLVTRLYEHGFTKLITEHNLTWGCIYTVKGRGVYNQVKRLYLQGMPFMKKNAFPRRGGALGGQILYVLTKVPVLTRDAILENATRIYGSEYIHWLLTKNPVRIAYRNLKYAMRKLFIEGI